MYGVREMGNDLIRHGFAVPPFHGTAVPVSLKTVHRTVFRALDAPKGEGYAAAPNPVPTKNRPAERGDSISNPHGVTA